MLSEIEMFDMEMTPREDDHKTNPRKYRPATNTRRNDQKSRPHVLSEVTIEACPGSVRTDETKQGHLASQTDIQQPVRADTPLNHSPILSEHGVFDMEL